MKFIYALIAFTSGIVFFSCQKHAPEFVRIDTVSSDEANVLKGATLVYCTSPGNIYSVDAVTGIEKWQASIGNKTIADGSPCVADGKVFITTKYPDAYAYAFDLTSGQQLWSKKLRSSIVGFYTDYGSPFVKDSFVYIPSKIALYKLNVNTGRQSWELVDSSGYSSEMFSSPVIINETVYCTRGAKMYALDSKSGKVKWIDSSLYNFSKSSPCVIDNKLYLAPYNPGLKAIDTLNNPLWQYPYADNGGNISPTSRNGLVYTSAYFGGPSNLAYQKTVYALNALNGKLRWTQFFEGRAENTYEIDINRNDFVTDKFYFVKMNDSLIALSAKNGLRVWGIKSVDINFSTSPVSYGNTVFIGSVTSMIAYDVNTGVQKWINNDNLGVIYAPVIVPTSGLSIHPTLSGMTQ